VNFLGHFWKKVEAAWAEFMADVGMGECLVKSSWISEPCTIFAAEASFQDWGHSYNH